MKTTTSLTGPHQRTFDRIFQHPISHNLEWRDVHALFEEIANVTKEHNGNLKVTRNGQILILHPTSKKDVTEMDEVMGLRHFLERSESVVEKSAETLSHDEIDRPKQDKLADAQFTVAARKAAEVNEGGLVDPQIP
jgi:adenylyl- and sulfurtransferase ThiI